MRAGDPAMSVPGKSIIIPETPEQIRARDFDLARVRRSYIRHALEHAGEGYVVTPDDIVFLAEDTNTTPAVVEEIIAELATG